MRGLGTDSCILYFRLSAGLLLLHPYAALAGIVFSLVVIYNFSTSIDKDESAQQSSLQDHNLSWNTFFFINGCTSRGVMVKHGLHIAAR